LNGNKSELPTNTQFEGGETRLVKGEKEVETLAYTFLERANSSYLIALNDNRVPKDTQLAMEYMRQIFAKNPNFRFQL
jgi:hypothetical protein